MKTSLQETRIRRSETEAESVNLRTEQQTPPSRTTGRGRTEENARSPRAAAQTHARRGPRRAQEKAERRFLKIQDADRL